MDLHHDPVEPKCLPKLWVAGIGVSEIWVRQEPCNHLANMRSVEGLPWLASKIKRHMGRFLEKTVGRKHAEDSNLAL